MPKLSEDRIADVLALLDSRLSYRQIAKRTGLSIGSISNIRAQYRPDIENLPAGRPPVLSPADVRHAQRLICSSKADTATKATSILRNI
ncbi:hypothetical protein EXIGLDRAFT_609978, partial [Exidia glandulosa HHB12029]